MCSHHLAPWRCAPENELRELILGELGIHIAPEALRIFIRANWDRVAELGHRIHEAKP